MLPILRSLFMLLAGAVLSLHAAEPIRVTDQDWPWWRGYSRNGKAVSGQNVPVRWDEKDNILWRAPLPGNGHGSPVVLDGKVFLATSDAEKSTQSVLAITASTGVLAWQRVVNKGRLPEKIHVKNTHASSTMAGDGHRVFATFYNHDAIHVVALGLNGEPGWEKRVGPFKPTKYQFGYGASPVLYGDNIIVVADHSKGGFLVALDRATGKQAWRVKRPEEISYSTPSIGRTGGRYQMLLSGGQQVNSYDPDTGKVLWTTPTDPTATCGTMVWDEERVYLSGGYPQKITAALRSNGGGVVWSNQQKAYEQSMLLHKGYLYVHTDKGIAYCFRAVDGTEMWSERLAGPVSASPVLVRDRIYSTTERGTTFVFKASPKKFEGLGENQLGDHGFATLAVTGNRIYLRAGKRQGVGRAAKVVETLYCIGE